MGVRVSDEEIDNAISNIAAQNRLTPDQLRQQLASDGLSYDDFRRSLRDELLTQRLDRKSTRLTPVTNAHLVCRLLLEKKQHNKNHNTYSIHSLSYINHITVSIYYHV